MKKIKGQGLLIIFGCLLIAVGLIIAAVFLSASLGQILQKMGVSQGTMSMIAGMLQGVMAAVAAALVIYELRKNARIDERENNIKEAQFILNYNQAFIQDKNMYEIESMLEKKWKGNFQS